ncbi:MULTISPECIES: hypothetical protein [unclassified Iodidimonas]|uniref:hypothetical protein n=1 Tax=unclassified Iodidimonas TaxID=2626145 RepID=UPI002482D3DE|nr:MULTISPECIES: hypothetical protein [unclassified Iodidimonas]
MLMSDIWREIIVQPKSPPRLEILGFIPGPIAEFSICAGSALMISEFRFLLMHGRLALFRSRKRPRACSARSLHCLFAERKPSKFQQGRAGNILTIDYYIVIIFFGEKARNASVTCRWSERRWPE